MPIIPVTEDEGQSFSPGKNMTLGVSDQPQIRAARTVAGLADLAQTGLDIYDQQKDAQGRLTAQSHHVKYVEDVENLKQRILNAPLKPYETSAADMASSEASGGEVSAGDWEFNKVGYKPKWETMQQDFQDGLKAINQQYDEKQDSYTRKYFAAYKARTDVAATRSIIQAGHAMYDQAQLASLQTTMDDIHKQGLWVQNPDTGEMMPRPPQKPTYDEKTLAPSFKIADNTLYTSQANLIDRTAANAKLAGMNPAMVEKMRTSEQAKLVKNTAEGAMHASPEAWIETTASGKNEWLGKLDETKRDALEAKAQSLIKSRRENDEHLAHLDKIQAETELDTLFTQKKLTDDAIQQRVPRLQGTAGAWMAKRKAQDEGDFNDVPALVDPVRVQALQFNPPPGVEAKLDYLLETKNMSAKTHQSLMNEVRHSRERELHRGDEALNRALSRDNDLINKTLMPPSLMRSDKPEYGSNLSSALTEYRDRLRTEGEANTAKIAKEVLIKYTGRIDTLVGNNQSYLLHAIQGKKPTYDRKTGAVDQDSLTESRVDAMARYNIHSDEEMAAARRRNDPNLPALLNQLQLIKEFETLGEQRAATRGSLEHLKSEKTQ